MHARIAWLCLSFGVCMMLTAMCAERGSDEPMQEDRDFIWDLARAVGQALECSEGPHKAATAAGTAAAALTQLRAAIRAVRNPPPPPEEPALAKEPSAKEKEAPKDAPPAGGARNLPNCMLFTSPQSSLPRPIRNSDRRDQCVGV